MIGFLRIFPQRIIIANRHDMPTIAFIAAFGRRTPHHKPNFQCRNKARSSGSSAPQVCGETAFGVCFPPIDSFKPIRLCLIAITTGNLG